MGDQPYRTIGQRVASPSSSLTMEQVVDLRLCVSAMSPDQCRNAINQLDDREVKNAVYDRVLCFPRGEWTKGIQETFAKRVHAANKNIIDFRDSLDFMMSILDRWNQVRVFTEEDFRKLEVDVKCHLSPCMDSIGVHSTLSDYTLTKRNGIEKLISVGLKILGTPIFYTPQGKAALTYDALSRAVGNILHSAADKTQRKRILEYGVDVNLEHLEGHARQAGIFLYLSRAISPDPAPATYWLPEIQPRPQAQQSRRRRKNLGQNNAQAKKPKWNNYPQQGIVNPEQGAVDYQQGTLSPQQGAIAPQQDVFNHQEGTIDPQLDTASFQQGVMGPQPGTFGVQADNNILADSNNALLNDLTDPRLWQTWCPQPEQSSSGQSHGFNHGSPAVSDGSSNPLGPPSSTPGQTHASSFESHQQPGPSGCGMEQEMGQAEGSQQLQNAGQNMPLLDQFQSAIQQQQQYQVADQMMPAQQMTAEQNFATGQQVLQQHQNVEQDMPVRYTASQKGKQRQTVEQVQEPQQASSHPGLQQNVPTKPTAARKGKKRQAVEQAQHSQPQQGVQHSDSAQLTEEQTKIAQQVLPCEGLQENMPAQPTASKKKPRAPRKKAKSSAAQSAATAQKDEEPYQLSYYKFEPASFDDLITDAYNELYVRKFDNPAQAQSMALPIVVTGRIETGAKMVHSRVMKVLGAPNVDTSKAIILRTKESAVWALLWFLEFCAIDRAGTALSAEVTRRLGRDTVVQSLWGCVKDSSAEDMKRLLYCVSARDGNNCTFEVKLDAIIQTLNITKVTGWERLQYVLDEMRRVASQA
ncbi:hypothetical protein VMCG_04008 [Cytospora schulzeri]|uniref:Uncharacterized protein n=1 Tax=Cytospora schulzeri TaxID=448051 RepID=A0A423WU21_9PEZI|nr:hypothetical protein VMCG_04008 [Valsa malicola]